jgi:hypothetical protein
MNTSRTALFVAVAAMVLTSFSGCLAANARADDSGAAGAADSAGSSGISWKPVVPIKSAAFVNYDPNSYLDDYAYLAAVPSSTFYSQSTGKIYSYPLVFYQPEQDLPDEQKVLNAGQGVKYFTDDWMTYADGKLDRVQFIDMSSSSAKQAMGALNISASARGTSVIPPGNPFGMARDIALTNWESSRTAVVAIMKESYPKATLKEKGTMNGTVPGSYKLESKTITGTKDVGITPIFHNFTVEEPYKYVQAHMTWNGVTGNDQIDTITQRGKDPDLTLYDWQLGECSASSNWNVESGPTEDTGSYVYHWGDWGFAVTYMPTKSIEDPQSGLAGLTTYVPDQLNATDLADTAAAAPADTSGATTDPAGIPPAPDVSKPSSAKYVIDYTLMPGVEVPLNKKVPYYARDITFTLSWSGDAKLGIAIIGPEGAEISYDATGVSPQQVQVSEMGEGQYQIAVVKLADSSSDANWKLDYSWSQQKTRLEGDCLAGAANAAVLASLEDAPLLYATPDGVPAETLEALDTLGVTKVELVDLNGHGGDAAFQGIGGHRSLLQPKIGIARYQTYTSIYNRITGMTKTQDAVFSTIDPWSFWNVGGTGPAGEQPKGLFIGPAALMAAHHGTPVLVVDNAPDLSCPKAWYDVFWLKAYPGRAPPSVSCMALTANSVYKYLRNIGIDKPGKENITTIADQFDIGSAWDRALVGGANAGRIMGSPVDASYWVCRCALYQAVIFANPATGADGVDMVTGTSSNSDPGPEVAGVRTITATATHATYPVVQTWVSYQHRFNERASKYWGTNYVSADGITPYWSPSDNPIDEGVNANYGQTGSYWPDITTSEVVPFYVEKAGYSSVYSTNFQDTMNNLNAGTIMWLEVMHGGNRADGIVGFWDDGNTHNEKCPWRGYEFTGCTREPDTYRMSKLIGLDVVRSVSQYDRDGVVIAIINQQGTVTKGGLAFDQALKNIHSMGFNGGSCLIANTYLHITMVRHGSVFQVIDPWLTSWYASFAMATFARGIAQDMTIGECYSEGIKHVGIEYLTGQWWWDIYENVIYFGDPKIKAWSPNNAWAEPTPLKAGASVDGHDPFGAGSHPSAIGSTLAWEIALYSSVAVVAAVVLVTRWKKIPLKSLFKRAKKQKA